MIDVLKGLIKYIAIASYIQKSRSVVGATPQKVASYGLLHFVK